MEGPRRRSCGRAEATGGGGVSRKEWSASAEVKEVAKEGLAVFREFRDFAVRGSVVDMAVGIIVGAAFTTVVKSLVSDVVTYCRSSSRKRR